MQDRPSSRPSPPRAGRPNRAVAAALALALALPGCAGGAGVNEPGLTPQQQALRQQSANWNRTVAEGAVLAGVAGAVAGALLAGPNNRAGGAAAGAGLGALIGALAGTQVAGVQGRQASGAQNAQERLASAQQSAQQLEQTADTAERTAGENRTRLAQLDRQYRAGQVTAAQYRQQAASMRRDAEVMRKAAKDADTASQEMVSQINRTPGLANEERKISEARSRLEYTASELETALRRVPAG